MNERGASTIIGLVLLIGLVAVGSVGIVVIGGGETDQLVDRATGDQAELTMSQLRDEVGSIVQGNEEGAGVSFPRADDESVVVEDQSRIEIIVYGLYSDDTVGSCTYNSSMGSLRYDTSGDATLGYEANGIFRLQDGNSVVVSPPNLQYRETEVDGKLVRTLDVPVVDIQSGTGGAGGNSVALSEGNTTARVGLCDGQTPIAHVDNATIRIENTDFHDGWLNYAEEEFGGIGDVTIDPDPDAGSNGAGTVVIRNVNLGEIPPSEYEVEDFDPGDDGPDGDDDGSGDDDPYANDWDQDGINNSEDSCVQVPNHDQRDQDGDGVGNKCESIWAYNNSTGTTTIHEVNWNDSADLGTLTDLEVDYPQSIPDGTTVKVNEIDKSDVSVIVMNGNGTVYNESNYGVASVTTDSNDKNVTISFGGSHDIQDDDTIRVKFADVKNPTESGDYSIDLTLNGDRDRSGSLEIVGPGSSEDTFEYEGVSADAENSDPGANTTHNVEWNSKWGKGQGKKFSANQEVENISIDYPEEVDVSNVETEDVVVCSAPGNGDGGGDDTCKDKDWADVEEIATRDGNSTLVIEINTEDQYNLNPATDINISVNDTKNPSKDGKYKTEVTLEATDDTVLNRTACLVIGDGSGSCSAEVGDSTLPPNGDVDNDGIANDDDNCKYTPNPKQYDADGDGEPLDVDDDGDGKLNTEDPDEGGNECDNDNDNDGIPDDEDATPYPGMADSNNTYVIDVTGNDVVVCDDSQSPEECKAN